MALKMNATWMKKQKDPCNELRINYNWPVHFFCCNIHIFIFFSGEANIHLLLGETPFMCLEVIMGKQQSTQNY